MPYLSLRLVAAGVAVGLACAGCAPATPRADAGGSAIDVPVIRHPDGETPDWWFRAGAAAANQNMASATRKSRAKNVIVFLGDGMSITTITAARIYDGQQKGGSGEENRLSFEYFPATALSRTYETDFQTADSAGTMTAIMSGVKTRAHGQVGENRSGGHVQRFSLTARPLDSLRVALAAPASRPASRS